MTVRSFVLWHLAVIIALQPSAPLLIIAGGFYLGFELVLWLRPMRGQI